MNYSRKEFLKTMSLAGTAALAGLSLALAADQSAQDSNLRLGLASYTLRTRSLDEVIRISVRLGLGSVALKSMHLPLEATTEEIRKAAEKVRAAGLRLYGAGVIYMKTAQEVENAFAYASTAGLEMIVGVPNHELLPQVNELVKKYNIKLAIHNHGPGDNLYASPDDVFSKIKSLDSRIGLCVDIGHVVRIGQDPIPLLEKYKERLYDLHMKDVNKAVADGTPVEIGRGIIDIPGVIRALKKMSYQGAVAIEYEKDGDDPLAGLAESVGYLRGIIRMV